MAPWSNATLRAKHAGGDQPVQMAVGIFQHDRRSRAVSAAQPLERVAQPGFGIEVAPQAARDQQAAQEAAAGQPRVDLLGLLFEQLALRLADLERGRVGRGGRGSADGCKAAPAPPAASAAASARGGTTQPAACLDRLAVGERVRDAADAGDPLGQHRTAARA